MVINCGVDAVCLWVQRAVFYESMPMMVSNVANQSQPVEWGRGGHLCLLRPAGQVLIDLVEIHQLSSHDLPVLKAFGQSIG